MFPPTWHMSCASVAIIRCGMSHFSFRILSIATRAGIGTSSCPFRSAWSDQTMVFQRTKPAAIVKARFPGFVEPELATSIEKVPSGERWLHEIKFDGYRVQVHLKDAVVKVFTRRGNDWTNRFRKIAADAWHINAGSAIVDGEVVVPAANGSTDFSVLQNDLKGRSTKILTMC